MELKGYREEIDRIDQEMVRLYSERMAVSEKIARYKIANGRSILDKDRERSKIESLRSMVQDEFDKKAVGELFSQIMSVSRKKQYELFKAEGRELRLSFIPVESLKKDNERVIFQGVNGAYSEAATIKFFGEDVNASSVESFRAAMQTIDEGLADYAVLPIENSSAGIVSANYDLLTEYENYIVGEIFIDVDNCLLALPDAELSDIKTVYSHPQALMQCNSFLSEHPEWDAVSYSNTAMAARKISEDGDKSKAAIAGARAAGVYGLKILQEDINFSDGNSTRFIIVTNQKIFVRNADKVSICFEVPHRSGSLYSVLSHFIYNDVNMSRIESRPIPDRPWEYRFFVDFDGNMSDPSTRSALRGIREETRNMRVLGNYQKGER